MAKESNWRRLIPEVKFDLTTKQQMYRVLDELAEAEEVLDDRGQFLEEMIDTIHASFNTLYKGNYTDKEISTAISMVIYKNEIRGKYK
jgi:hypothetical protein